MIGFSEAARARLGARLDELGLTWHAFASAANAPDSPAADAPDSPAATRLRHGIARGEAIAVFGDQLAPAEVANRLARLLPSAPPPGSALVLAAGEHVQLFEPFVAADAVFYLSRALPAAAEVAELLRAATARREPLAESPAARLGPQVDDLLHELDRQTESAPIAGRLAREIEVVLQAETAHVWFFDRDRDVLWRPAEWTSKEHVHRESAAAGLIGFVARTGSTVDVERLGEDPRYDADADGGADSPATSGQADAGQASAGQIHAGQAGAERRFLAAAVGDQTDGSAANCVGVLVALRPASDPAFDRADRDRLEYLARRLLRIFQPLVERHENEQRQQVMSEQAATAFRREALEHYTRPADFTGRVLEISPAWMHRVLWVLAAAALAALLFAAVTRVDETSSGPAVVIVDGESARVLSLMPARLRPLLAGGMSARFDLDGFGAIERTTLEEPGAILSAQQARDLIDPRHHRVLGLGGGQGGGGQGGGGQGGSGGPFVLLEAPLADTSFEHRGRQLELHDGLPGRLEVVTASSGLLESLIPGAD